MVAQHAQPPVVTFLVLCYKYAHFLRACVDSILAQSYRDFEVLILDDCSPDDTPVVAASFSDNRVRHIRHATNVGIVENFNRGFEHARGRYLWCISADDRLRDANVLGRYVSAFERNPNLGIAFCPAVALRNDTEQEVLRWTTWPGPTDCVVSSREFLEEASRGCPVCAPTGMLRADLVRQAGGYQADLPRSTDWYLWAAAAARANCHYDAKPMVAYRIHEASMEHTLARSDGRMFYDQTTLVRWRIVDLLAGAGHADLWRSYRDQIAKAYAAHIAIVEAEKATWGFCLDDAVADARRRAPSALMAEDVIARLPAALEIERPAAHTRLGDRRMREGNVNGAIEAYMAATHVAPHSRQAAMRLRLARFQQTTGFPMIAAVRHLRAAWTGRTGDRPTLNR